jgi:hypothetical protein
MLVQFPWSFRTDETNRDWLGDIVDTFGEYVATRWRPR